MFVGRENGRAATTSLTSGVNIVKGTVMNPRGLRSAMRVAPEVQNLCRQDIAGLVFCLKTTLMLPPLPEWAYHLGY